MHYVSTGHGASGRAKNGPIGLWIWWRGGTYGRGGVPRPCPAAAGTPASAAPPRTAAPVRDTSYSTTQAKCPLNTSRACRPLEKSAYRLALAQGISAAILLRASAPLIPPSPTTPAAAPMAAVAAVAVVGPAGGSPGLELRHAGPGDALPLGALDQQLTLHTTQTTHTNRQAVRITYQNHGA